MKGLLRLLVVGALVLPAPVAAQAVTRAKLVGTWLQTYFSHNTEDRYQNILTLGADGTWKLQGRHNDSTIAWANWEPVLGVTQPEDGPWRLSGDSLVLSEFPYKVALQNQGQQLVLGYNYIEDNFFANICPRVLTRIDPSKPIPVVTRPPNTVKPSDLAGTWVSRGGKGTTAGGTDTLTFRADSTWTWTHAGGAVQTGSWALLPDGGDRVEFKGKTTDIRTVLVEPQGKRLFIFNGFSPCEEAKQHSSTWAYDRLKP